MQELTCVITTNARGWLLIVGGHPREWFPDKDEALRAAIAEAQRNRARGIYSSVTVQHGLDPSKRASETRWPSGDSYAQR